MLEEIKLSIRMSNNKLDSDIQRNIDACMLDLERVGVNTENHNGLLVKAAELYCKSEFDYLGKGEKFRKNYEELRTALSMSEEYKR